MAFLQNLPTIYCTEPGCGWRRCAQRENIPELEMLAAQHITETDGHALEVVNYLQYTQVPQ